jgi:adenylate cyclase class 1
MAEKNTTLRGLADAFKRSLYPVRPGFSEQAQAIVEVLAGPARPARDPDAAGLRAAGELALHLLVWAEAQTGGLGYATAMRGLLNLGRFGWIAAVRLLRGRNVTLQQLAQTNASLPMRERLFLAHELLREPEIEDKQLLQWAREDLAALAQCDPEQALEALSEIAGTGEPVAHLVKETLLRGPFLPWIEGLLGQNLAAGTLERLARGVQALASEALTAALAAHVSERPESASPGLVRALTRSGETPSGAAVRAVQAVLRAAKDPALILTCLDALLALNWPKVGQVATLLFRKDESLRQALLARLALFSESDFRLFVSALPDAGQRTAYARAFVSVLEFDPDFVDACLDREAKGQSSPRLDRGVEGALRALVAERRKALLTASGPVCGPVPAASAPAQEPGEDKRGLLSRLKGDKRPNLAEALDKGRDLTSLDLVGASLVSAAVQDRAFVGVGLAEAVFEKVRFDRVRFSAADLSAATFKAAVFTNCTFTNVRLAGAAFSRSTFSACAFDRCELSGAEFADCALTSSEFQRCVFGGGLLANCTLESCVFDLCCFAGADFAGTTIRLGRFFAADFSAASFSGAVFSGVEAGPASLRRAVALSSSFQGFSLRHATLAEACLRGLDTREPALLRRRAEGILEAPGLGGNGALTLPKAALEEVGFGFMKRAVHLWSRHWQIARHEWPMLESNRRRIDFAQARLTAEQGEFFRLLPHLLHGDAFEKALGLPDVPACEVFGHEPGPTILALFRKHFPKAPPREQTPGALRIEAVYTIGSLGSVAQTASSDIDYWVCFDPAGVSAEAVAGLKRKLAALSTWAGAKFELETHFFAMSMEAIRANDFGLSDKESAGSTQAILLKEEFYRTAARVAGKDLAWWVTPPGAGERAFQDWTQAALEYPLRGLKRYADFGSLARIPPEEFFGASLWQIVKALHSPYKSVMKLGLLERYAGMVGEHGLMLCDQIKRHLLEGRREVRDVDPYTVLFKELEAFYLGLKDKDAVSLMREAFLLKAGLSVIDFSFGCATRREEQSFLSAVFGPGGATPEAAAGRGRPWAFSRSMQVGATVNRYMINTYQRIQSQLSPEVRAKARITPEDLTKLGRQIIASFAPKPGKVVRVPFLLAAEGEFPELHFSAEKAPGKRTVWIVQGKEKSEAKTGTRNMQVLKKDLDPVALLAWLAVNKLYTPKALVDGERSIAPLAAVDIQKLLAGLYEFFPFEETFEVDSAAYLSPERVLRAFFVLNLTAPLDVQKVLQAWVVYSTSFGELFCSFFDKPSPALAKQPLAFLREGLPLPLAEGLKTRLFVPKRSQCPRIPIPTI